MGRFCGLAGVWIMIVNEGRDGPMLLAGRYHPGGIGRCAGGPVSWLYFMSPNLLKWAAIKSFIPAITLSLSRASDPATLTMN